MTMAKKIESYCIDLSLPNSLSFLLTCFSLFVSGIYITLGDVIEAEAPLASSVPTFVSVAEAYFRT